MSRFRRRLVGVALLLCTAGCRESPAAGPRSPSSPVAGPGSDLEAVRAADVSILFVGNSHTAMHDLPELVGGMIRFRRPAEAVGTHTLAVGFLDEVARDPKYRAEVESRPWTHVVLQAQKISMSGRVDYSRAEAIDFAKLAKGRGAAVVFYPEWGLKGVPGDGPRQEKVYREMARDAGVGVAPVARAWDLALAARPELPLHAADGNHQSAVGAFLTACVLYGRITGDSPAPLAAYPYPPATETDRRFLADVAAQALAEKEGDE